MQRTTLKNSLIETHLFNRRVIFAIVIMAILLSVLIGRLIYLQIYQHKLFTTLSEENQLSLIPLDPNRGLIYDRNGVLLAENIPVFSLDVIPERVGNFKNALTEIQKIITITKEDLQQFQKLRRQKRSTEGIPLKLTLSEEEVAKFYLDEYKFPGFRITGRLMRYYPQGDTMVSALGYVSRINEEEMEKLDDTNYAASDYIGKLGIEKYYESQLHGKVGYQQVEIDASGRVVRVLKRIPPVAGDSLYLSLDTRLQIAAEDALGEDQGAVIAIEPSTGQILAFVSNPRYDPNLFVKGVSFQDYKELRDAPEKPLYNRAIRGLYPPGSTIKPFLGLQALDTKSVSPNDRIIDNGFYYLPGTHKVFRDWNWRKGGHGIVNFHKAIVQSCDVYFYTLAARMGITKLNDIESRFGLGRPTGLDVTEELGGVAPSPAWKRKALGQAWYSGDTVNSGIGQGFTLVTPLQMASAVSAIATQGTQYQPRFMLKWQKPDGSILNPAPVAKAAINLKDPKNWGLVISAMEDVVNDPRGTAHRLSADNPPYTMAAKTGTAQVFRPKEYGDEDSASIPKKYRSHSWLIVFAPVEKPQIAMAILVENHPHQAVYVAKKILDYYLLPEYPQANNATSVTTTQPTNNVQNDEPE